MVESSEIPLLPVDKGYRGDKFRWGFNKFFLCTPAEGLQEQEYHGKTINNPFHHGILMFGVFPTLMTIILHKMMQTRFPLT